MTYDRDYEKRSFLALVEQKAKQRNTSVMPAMRAVQAAGVIMAKLTTGSDEWNRYLSYVQGQIERIKERKAAAQEKQNDPAIWDIAERNKLKADIIDCDAMIRMGEWCMALPKALVDGGEEAQKFLNKLDRENEAGKPTAES